jgi:type VI protein secretion system component VasK
MSMSREQTEFRARRRIRTGGLAGAACLVALFGCATTAPTEQMTRAETIVQRAEEARDIESAALSLRKAQDELKAAQKAMQEEEYLEARRKAERAEVDAELALIEAERARANKAADELKSTIAAMEQEIGRMPPVGAGGGVR